MTMLVLCELGAPAARAAAVPSPAPASGAPGRRLFAHHCASCHGPNAQGDGPDASLFDPPPPALTPEFLRQHPLAALVGRIRDGGPELALDPAALRRRATDVEAIAAHLERLPQIDWRVVERGQEIYVDRCEICHGPYGRPDGVAPQGGRLPRDLSDPAFQRAVGDAGLVEGVRHGRKGMPALVPRLEKDDARAVLAFVRLLSPGYERYTRYCAACHGDDGRGAGSLAETEPAPSVVFDRAYFTKRDREQVRVTIWHMLDQKTPHMPHFRERLTAAEAEAIIVYLSSRP